MPRISPLVILRVATLPFETLAPLEGARARATAEAALDRLEARRRDAERLSASLYEVAGASAAEDRHAARGAVLRIRRAIHQGRAVPESTLEEADDLLDPSTCSEIRMHLEVTTNAAQAELEFSRVYAEEIQALRAALVDASKAPTVRLGLRLAGRSLLQRAEGLARRDTATWGPRERHAASKVLAYLSRFATKTSPNGVFSATGISELSDGPPVLAGENQIARMDFLLHVGEARKITACLAASPGVMARVIPRANPTLRRVDDGWAYWRPASPRRPDDDEVLCRVKEHPVMRMFLDAAQPADKRAPELIRDVGARAGRDVEAFYSQLVDRGILIGEVEIPWSERRPLQALAACCPEASWAAPIEELECDVEALARCSAAEIPPRLDALAERMESLPHVRPLSTDDLVRCDASTRLEVRVPRSLLHDLARLVPLYAAFYGAIYPERLYRESFSDRFLRHFPADKPVPVLDLYHGLFEPVPETRPPVFASPASSASNSPLRRAAAEAFEAARSFFTRRAQEAAAAGQEEVELTEEDWAVIAGGAAEPRYSCAALFQVAARSLDDVAAGRARVCLNAFFPGAGLSVARLAHLHDGGGDFGPIHRHLHEGWARCVRPGAIHAEVTFMHGGRTANAGLRPPIFPVEIELPGDRVSAGRDVIPLSDLTASYESSTGQFALHSLSRGAEILPVICSGINPEGFVSFLTMIGGQGLQALGLFPGFDVPGIRSWPRFRFGNVVLFRRRWVFDAAELPVGEASGAYYLATRRWCREHALPDHVFVHSDRDPKPFYANLGSAAFVDRFRRAVETASAGAGARARVHVTEMLPGAADLWVRDSRGRYASEFLVHLDNLDRVDAEDV